MMKYRLQFRGQDKGPPEEFRDLALAKSQVMERAADRGLGAGLDDPDDWICRIYEGEDLIHEVVLEDLPQRGQDGRHVTPAKPVADFEGDRLDEALDESFPASDPPSPASPTVATKSK